LLSSFLAVIVSLIARIYITDPAAPQRSPWSQDMEQQLCPQRSSQNPV